ncbi:unnamed protein product [Phaedon cochleariae]|uniref:Uncharacterized protein n=1 Tax=Phaedon cochleariae TaxID=80249 RepID=A0A9N9X1T0_PHACE|nr:unnamed protein product [Phaedon cochleariae]
MDNLIDLVKPTTDDLVKHNISSEQWQEFSTLLKQRTHVYREENARLETVLTKLKILNNEIKLLADISNDVSKLIRHSLTDIIDMKRPSTHYSTTLTQPERLRKHNNYVSKLKICIKMYVNLNERLSKEIKFIKWESDQSRVKLSGILNLSSQEVQQLEEKAKKYENELLKFEKKYPWLKDPQFNLPNISKEIEMLRNLKETKEKLARDLSIYQELKPDIKEAAQQLADLKEEHKHFTTKIQDTNKC